MLSFQPKSLRQTCFTLMSHLWAGFSAENWVLVILAPAEELELLEGGLLSSAWPLCICF